MVKSITEQGELLTLGLGEKMGKSVLIIGASFTGLVAAIQIYKLYQNNKKNQRR